TGAACTGSRTPPICAAALTWTRAPTCAQEPTRACESIIVCGPTQAPTFTNIGGMHTTPLDRNAPRLTVDPPGTMRTPCDCWIACAGKRCLSKKRNDDLPP